MHWNIYTCMLVRMDLIFAQILRIVLRCSSFIFKTRHFVQFIKIAMHNSDSIKCCSTDIKLNK